MNIKCELLIIFIASGGFTWQMTSITLVFMNYQSVNELTIEAARYLPVPSITLCAYLPTLVNETALRELFVSRNLSESFIHIDSFGVRNLSQHMSAGDYFKVTPTADELWQQFRYRLPNEYSVKECRDNCSSMFTWSRYIHLYFMCYRYSQRYNAILESNVNNRKYTSDETYSFFRIAHSLENPKLHLQIDFDHEKLLNVSLLGIHCTSEALVPHTTLSHYWSIFQYPVGYNRLKLNRLPLNMLFLSYKFTRTESLPPPYPSMCRDYSKEKGDRGATKQECLARCVQRSVAQKMFLMTTSSLIVEPSEDILRVGRVSPEWYEYPLYSSIHGANETLRQTYKLLVKECAGQCSHENCVETRFFTELKKGEIRKLADNGRKSLTVRMYVPDSTTTKSKFIPEINFNTYIIYILNSFSFWTGLSIFSLHTVPGKIVHLYKCLTSKSSSDGNVVNNHSQCLRVDIGKRKRYLRVDKIESRVKIRVGEEERIKRNKGPIQVRQIVEEVNSDESRRVRRVRKRPPFDPQERASFSYYPRI